jgi:hypothetical protein
MVSAEQGTGVVPVLCSYFCLQFGTLVLLLEMEAVNKKNLSFAIP